VHDKEDRGRVSRACDANGGYQPKLVARSIGIICEAIKTLRAVRGILELRIRVVSNGERGRRRLHTVQICPSAWQLVRAARSRGGALAGGN
jgi:hypothetical protein